LPPRHTPRYAHIHNRRYRQFCARLRAAREAAELTQVEVSKALGESQSFVAKCEVGLRRVDVIELERFARLYRKPLRYFLGGA
jgi:transcriptional regulator with XRE-family HTH domain